MKKRYTNKELIYYRYFFQKTNVYPEHIIIIKNFIFYFVKNEDYFKAKRFLNPIRNQLGIKTKVIIIRAEKNLIRLLFGFFPDLYIHDIAFDICKHTGKITVSVYFLSFEERGIAIGKNGDYIKAVNEIFDKFVIFIENIESIRIKCKLIEL